MILIFFVSLAMLATIKYQRHYDLGVIYMTPRWPAWFAVSQSIVSLIMFGAALQGQIATQRVHPDSLLTESFEVTNVDRMDAILMLARRYSVPLGIEFVGDAMFQPVTVRVPSGDSIKTALDLLAPSSSGFLITKHDNVFVISHQSVPRAGNVLNTILDEINVPAASIQVANWNLVVALDRQHRKEAGISQPKGYGWSLAGTGSRPIASFTAMKISVRDVLDRIIGEDGHAVWIVQVQPSGLIDPTGLIDSQPGRLDKIWTVVDYDSGPIDGISHMTQYVIDEARSEAGR